MKKLLQPDYCAACYIKDINKQVLLEAGEIPELCRNGNELSSKSDTAKPLIMSRARQEVTKQPP